MNWSALTKIWRGEVSLYRAAYGLGGVGAVALTSAGDFLVGFSTRAGGIIAGGCFALAAFGQLIFTWICIVATWRARRSGPGQPYPAIAIFCAVGFVWLQLALTAAWVGWSGLAELRLVSAPADVLMSRVFQPEWGRLEVSLKAFGIAR
jgi:hypothetical protein